MAVTADSYSVQLDILDRHLARCRHVNWMSLSPSRSLSPSTTDNRGDLATSSFTLMPRWDGCF